MVPVTLSAQYSYESEKVDKYRATVDFDIASLAETSDDPGEEVPVNPTGFSRDGVGVWYEAPPALDKLVSNHRSCTPEEGPGFRIQIYAGPELARVKEVRLEFLKEFDDIPVFNEWNPPTFRVHVGNYLTERHAYEELFKIKAIYPAAFVIPVEKVEYPRYRDPNAIPDPDEEDLFDHRDPR